MRQLFLDRGTVIVKDVCKPLLHDTCVLVEVSYSFISSGTELATIAHAGKRAFFTNVPEKIKKIMTSLASNGVDGTAALVRSKLKGELQSLGYSCSGKVIAVGKKVKKFKTGDLVACAGAGYAHHADIVCVPEHLVAKVHEEKWLLHASATTLGAIALQGIRRAQLQIGESVCVIGLGLLGQLTVQIARQAGCTVVGVDLIRSRLDLAQKCGADVVYDGVNEEIQREIAYLTNHHGVDVTIIAAASTSDVLVQQAVEVTRKKGKVIIVGDVGLGFKRDPLYAKEIDLLISCSYGPGRYDVQYEQYGIDKKILMGKYVSEKFKERHSGDWKKRNPTQHDIIIKMSEEFGTTTRWQKAFQHLIEEGTIEGVVQDIPILMREINTDILQEHEEEIKDRLFKFFWKKISRGVTKGFPEWYKNKLMEIALEETNG